MRKNRRVFLKRDFLFQIFLILSDAVFRLKKTFLLIDMGLNRKLNSLRNYID